MGGGRRKGRGEGGGPPSHTHTSTLRVTTPIAPPGRAKRREQKRNATLTKLVNDRFNERKLSAKQLKESLKTNSLLTKPANRFDPVAYAKEFDRLHAENPLAFASGPDGAPLGRPRSPARGKSDVATSKSSVAGSRAGSRPGKKRGKRDEDSVLAPR